MKMRDIKNEQDTIKDTGRRPEGHLLWTQNRSDKKEFLLHYIEQYSVIKVILLTDMNINRYCVNNSMNYLPRSFFSQPLATSFPMTISEPSCQLNF